MGEAPASHPHIAVLMTGLKGRLVLESTLVKVLRWNVGAGYRMHVFAHFVDKFGFSAYISNLPPARPDPVLLKVGPRPQAFAEWFRSKVESTGAKVVHFSQQRPHEHIDPLPDFARKRWGDYNPFFTDGKGFAGRNLLRRYKSAEMLWNLTRRSEKLHHIQYEFVLWIRDDPYWIQPLDLRSFPKPPYERPRMYTRDCALYNGFNDKTLLLDRKAAPFMLSLYSTFYNNSDPRLAFSTGAEVFVTQVADIKGVDSFTVPFSRVSNIDAEFYTTKEGHVGVCLKELYAWNCLTGSLPQGVPSFCPT